MAEQLAIDRGLHSGERAPSPIHSLSGCRSGNDAPVRGPSLYARTATGSRGAQEGIRQSLCVTHRKSVFACGQEVRDVR